MPGFTSAAYTCSAHTYLGVNYDLTLECAGTLGSRLREKPSLLLLVHVLLDCTLGLEDDVVKVEVKYRFRVRNEPGVCALPD